jgi:hypothetical protein
MAKQAESTKIKPVKEKRKELEASGVKTRTKTTSPTPQASTPTTKWDPETNKRVKQVVRKEIEEEDRKKPKVLTAKTPDTGGASSVVGVDMYTASLPTGMPAQSFSRSAAPKPFDVQFRPDGNLYVYGPVWNTYAVKLSKDGAPAVEGKWNSVGVPTCSTLYAVQEDTLGDACEVKSSKHYLAFSVGKDSDDVKYTATKVAKKFNDLGWRSLASGALITVGGTSETGVAVEDTPLAWTVQKRKDGRETEEKWKVFSPVWVDGDSSRLPGTVKLGEWTSLGVTSGTVYAVYKETSSKPKEGESEEDVTWSFTSLTISNSGGVNTPPQAPSGGTGSATDGSAGIRFTNVPIGKFENGDFTQYHEGVIVTGYSGGGGGGSSGGGSSWGYGPVEWDRDNQRFVQYKGTFDEDGDFTPVGNPEVVLKVKSHRDDHTQGII